MYFSTEELDHTVKLAERFFLQNNLFKFKKPNTKSTKTNHYILLTNVSIKHLGGGKSSSQTNTSQTLTSVIQVMSTKLAERWK